MTTVNAADWLALSLNASESRGPDLGVPAPNLAPSRRKPTSSDTGATAGRRGGRPPACDRQVYRRRNVVERCFNRLKGFRGIATGYDKIAISYETAVSLASFLLWARSV
ncbi:hypothetical protein ACIPPJ_33355 [Streptomyces sp. NPDC086091]|uniref:hypothetical protein n=1 Tax=Streptomyces sp. NPDC086091 TaxID=3365751 RepID=UPI003829A689